MSYNALTQAVPADDGSVKWFLLYDFLPRRSAEKLIHTPAIWESDDPASCFQSDEITICTYLSWGLDRGLFTLETLIEGYDIYINLEADDFVEFIEDHPIERGIDLITEITGNTGGLVGEIHRILSREQVHAQKLPVNADDIAAESRRKIKKNDIILAELAKSDEASDSSDYLVFTETALYRFVNHKIQNIIRYAEIEDADFTDDSVSVTTQDKNCVNIEVGTSSDIKEKSPRILFNLLMDIKERIENKQPQNYI